MADLADCAGIDTGDYVYHRPTRESWAVRRVAGEYLHWCGWPAGRAQIADCRLIYKATDAERDRWREEIRQSEARS